MKPLEANQSSQRTNIGETPKLLLSVGNTLLTSTKLSTTVYHKRSMPQANTGKKTKYNNACLLDYSEEKNIQKMLYDVGFAIWQTDRH